MGTKLFVLGPAKNPDIQIVPSFASQAFSTVPFYKNKGTLNEEGKISFETCVSWS